LAPKQKRKKELELISYDELLGSSSMTGLVSFLDIRPKQDSPLSQAVVSGPGVIPLSGVADPIEAARAAQPAAEAIDQEGLLSLLSGSRVPPASSLLSDSNQHPDSSLPSGSSLLPAVRANKVRSMPKRDAGGLQSVSSFLPDSDLLQGLPQPENTPSASNNLLPDLTLLPDSDLLHDQPGLEEQGPPTSNLLSSGDLITANGRTVRVRIARSVQDAHTSAEHMLLTAMWKKGSSETDDTRLLRVGLGELSRWTGSHKTSCRAYIRALIAKLAIEEAEPFDAAAGSEGARVYRIFSFNRILERRRLANFTHVIRTGAVSFVDPKTGEKRVPGSTLPSGSTQHPGSNVLPDSKLPSESGSNHPPIPGSNQRGIINKREENLQQTTATIVYEALAAYGMVDGAALTKLIHSCRSHAPDCSDQEIAHFIHEKGILTKSRESRIQNPIGFLIDAVPKCFLGESFTRYRQAKAAQVENGGREVPIVAEQIQNLERLLEAFPDHPQASENRRRLAELRQAMERE